jgi:hypothetical protein
MARLRSAKFDAGRIKFCDSESAPRSRYARHVPNPLSVVRPDAGFSLRDSICNRQYHCCPSLKKTHRLARGCTLPIPVRPQILGGAVTFRDAPTTAKSVPPAEMRSRKSRSTSVLFRLQADQYKGRQAVVGRSFPLRSQRGPVIQIKPDPAAATSRRLCRPRYRAARKS